MPAILFKKPLPRYFPVIFGKFFRTFFYRILVSCCFCLSNIDENFVYSRGRHLRCSLKKFRKIHRKAPVSESFFNKVAGLRPAILLKKKLWHIFSCEFCEISKNTLFTEHLRWLLLILWLSCHHLSAFAFNFELVHTWFLCLIPGGIIFLDLIEWKGDV